MNIITLVLVGDFFISYPFARANSKTLFSRITHTFTNVLPKYCAEQPFMPNVKLFVFIYASSFLLYFSLELRCSRHKCVALKSSLIKIRQCYTENPNSKYSFYSLYLLSVFVFNWITPFYTYLISSLSLRTKPNIRVTFTFNLRLSCQ